MSNNESKSNSTNEPAFCLSPPMPCPCPDDACSEECVEVGCRTHPTAGLRAFFFGDGVQLICSECMQPIARVAGPTYTCAKRAENSNNLN